MHLAYVACQRKILVQVPAILAPNAPIVESVKLEYGVEQLVGSHVFQKVSERIEGAGQFQDMEKAGSVKILRLAILGVQGYGGGSWSGAKGIAIRAELSQNGQVFQTNEFQRHSRGGMFGGVSGTCPIMERVAIELGQDVANWLPFALRMSLDPALAPQSDVQPTKEQSATASEPKQ